jgi:hypothetical protein
MKLIWGLLLGAMLYVVPASADQLINYTLSVENIPGIGDLSWTIQTDGFIQPIVLGLLPGDNCQTDLFTCGDHTSFVAVSEPTEGNCQISSVWLNPDYSMETYFSPFCDGKYEALYAGAMPEPGILGTWSFEGTNRDGGQTLATWTISEPPGAAAPEPGTWGLLGLGLALLGAKDRVRAIQNRMTE